MQILEPDYISKFECDGSKCNSKCCKHWLIDIDDATLSKYKHIKPTSRAKEITRHIKEKKHPFKGKINSVTLNAEGKCPFLDMDNLCFIQKNYGEDYLSLTCKIYPRLNYKIAEDFMYRTLSLTCPVVCNLVLNAPRDSGFKAYELAKNEIAGIQNFTKGYKSFMLPVLNVTNYNILRCQDLTLDERLAVVALFSESANDAVTLNDVSNIAETFEKEVLKNAKEILEPIKFDSLKFLKEILSFIHTLFTGIGRDETAQIYVKFINEVFGISLLETETDELDFGRIEQIYEEIYEPAKKELFEMNDLQIENYAINYLFMSALPISKQVYDFRKNISKFLLEFKMAEFIFVCFYAAIRDKWHKIAIELAAEDISTCFENNLEIKTTINDRFRKTESVMPIIQLLLDV